MLPSAETGEKLRHSETPTYLFERYGSNRSCRVPADPWDMLLQICGRLRHLTLEVFHYL